MYHHMSVHPGFHLRGWGVHGKLPPMQMAQLPPQTAQLPKHYTSCTIQNAQLLLLKLYTCIQLFHYTKVQNVCPLVLTSPQVDGTWHPTTIASWGQSIADR